MVLFFSKDSCSLHSHAIAVSTCLVKEGVTGLLCWCPAKLPNPVLLSRDLLGCHAGSQGGGCFELNLCGWWQPANLPVLPGAA